MGRDTGIDIVKLHTKENTGDYVRTLCYWRKCHGVANDINMYLAGVGRIQDPREGCAETTLTVSDLRTISAIIKSYMSPEEWKYNADSIWDYDEVEAELKSQIRRLWFARLYLRLRSDLRAVYYDSK